MKYPREQIAEYKRERRVVMKKIYEAWTSVSLVKRIVAGLVLGVVLGMACPSVTGIALFGDVFVGALKAVAPLLVFFLIISSLCHSGKSHGGVIKTVIILYMFSTFLAALVAVIASFAFPVTLTLADAATDLSAPQGIAEVMKSLLMNIVSNPVASIINANYIGILAWAVLFGIGLRGAKEETKKIREELNQFKNDIGEIDSKSEDDKIARKMEQIMQRKERKEKRKKDKATRDAEAAQRIKEAQQKRLDEINYQPKAGDDVRIKGLKTVGKVETVDGKMATVIFGDMRTKMPASRLQKAEARQEEQRPTSISRETRETIDNRKLNFKSDLDVRGMRGDEALNAVMNYIDDAILVGMSRVRILHGKGNGILRQLIRQYLSTIPNVTSFRDEHIQFGGAGITVVVL